MRGESLLAKIIYTPMFRDDEENEQAAADAHQEAADTAGEAKEADEETNGNNS